MGTGRAITKLGMGSLMCAGGLRGALKRRIDFSGWGGCYLPAAKMLRPKYCSLSLTASWIALVMGMAAFILSNSS